MDGTAFILSLEELCLIKISIVLWSQKELEIYTQKYPKEDLDSSKTIRSGKKKKLPYKMRKVLELVHESIEILETALPIKRKLVDKSERIGYELFLFMNENSLNRSRLKFFTVGNFSRFDVYDINVSNDLKWTLNGEISFTETLISYIKNHPNSSPFLIFTSACENCDEIVIFDSWENFSPQQRRQIENALTADLFGRDLSPDTKIILSYWLCRLKNSFDGFTPGINFRIDNGNSLHYNFLIYSLNSCFRNRVLYFYSNLMESEKEKFVEVSDGSSKKILSLEQMKASYKFFEAPVLNHKINRFIVDNLTEDSFEYLIDYCISKLLSFGNLHGNVILYLMSLAPEEIKMWTLNDLNFYLQLIEYGQINVVRGLLDEKTKKLLREEILIDEALLKDSTNVFVNYVQTIYRNGYYDLLVEFFNTISEDNDLVNVLVTGAEKANIKVDIK